MVIPKERQLLAMMIAAEWENQDQVLKQYALPLVSCPRYTHSSTTDDLRLRLPPERSTA